MAGAHFPLRLLLGGGSQQQASSPLLLTSSSLLSSSTHGNQQLEGEADGCGGRKVGSCSQGGSYWLGGSQSQSQGISNNGDSQASEGGGGGLLSQPQRKAPRVGKAFQLTSVPMSHFGDGEADSAHRLPSSGLVGRRVPLHDPAAATRAGWSPAERAAFEAAFFAHPREWGRIAQEIPAIVQAAAAAAARAMAATPREGEVGGEGEGHDEALYGRVHARPVHEILAYFFQCFLPDSAAYESYLRTGQLPPAIQHQQRQQHPERGRTALGHTQLARKHSTACLSSRPSSSLVSRPPTSSSASDEEKEGEEEAEYGVPPLTPIYSWDGDDDGGRSGGSAKRRKLEVTGLEALARAAEQSGDVLTWGTNGEEEEDGEEEKAKHQEEKGREEEEDAVMAEDGAGHSPEAMRVAVAAATALAAASSFPLPPPRAPSFTFDDRFPEAFALAFLAHPKDWPQILQALHTQGITATVPTDTRLLKRWYHEAFQASPHYLSYLMSKEHRDLLASKSRHLLPPPYHDEEACYWGGCKARVFTAGVEIVLCETCPNASHKRQQCSGPVRQDTPWLCEECRAKYKNKSRAEQQAQQAAIAAVGRAIAVIDRRRDAAIDAMVARECARALPRIEAAARMAAEKGQGREGLKRARVGEGEAGWSMDGRGGV